jgi:hypothetical protein
MVTTRVGVVDGVDAEDQVEAAIGVGAHSAKVALLVGDIRPGTRCPGDLQHGFGAVDAQDDVAVASGEHDWSGDRNRTRGRAPCLHAQGNRREGTD